jgi:hypothetical protein
VTSRFCAALQFVCHSSYCNNVWSAWKQRKVQHLDCCANTEFRRLLQAKVMTDQAHATGLHYL